MTSAELFGPDFWRDLMVALLGIALGIWLPAYLSLRRFRTRQWWERKADFYMKVMAELSNLAELDDELMEDVEFSRQRSEEDRNALEQKRRETQRRLGYLAREGAIVLSPGSLAVIRSYFADNRRAGEEPDLFSFFEARQIASDKALKALIAEARKDLKVRE